MTFNHLRVARPVRDLDISCQMYCAGLGIKKIGQFINHSGFSGVMLGRSDLSWHLEFTHCLSHPLCPAPTADDLLVLYIPAKADWIVMCQQMCDAGFAAIESFNPYWETAGRTFSDQDGYRTVIQHQNWTNI